MGGGRPPFFFKAEGDEANLLLEKPCVASLSLRRPSGGPKPEVVVFSPQKASQGLFRAEEAMHSLWPSEHVAGGGRQQVCVRAAPPEVGWWHPWRVPTCPEHNRGIVLHEEVEGGNGGPPYHEEGLPFNLLSIPNSCSKATFGTLPQKLWKQTKRPTCYEHQPFAARFTAKFCRMLYIEFIIEG